MEHEPNLWSVARQSGAAESAPSADTRTDFERDYDRLLFSAPVRRLADKTQVFPLDKNDSVRTRLTHSHEVANIARSLGNRIVRSGVNFFQDCPSSVSAVPTILSTVGLGHDLGNPPFGHQGEAAIGSWFAKNTDLFTKPGGAYDDSDGFQPLEDAVLGDFLRFEGNAQALRLLTKLQSVSGANGLNLTATTLAALMKYPVPSSRTDKAKAPTKKFGYFCSEKKVVDFVRDNTGLKEGERHPLAWLMEASDDVAYSVLDLEDAIKKRLFSPEDLFAFLRSKFGTSDLGGLMNTLEADFKRADNITGSLSRVMEVKASYIRTRVIERLMTGAITEFGRVKDSILNCTHNRSLLESGSPESELCQSLKDFALAHAYKSSNVLELEFQGHRTIHYLMDCMWSAISSRKSFRKLDSKRSSPKGAYVYSLISESYSFHFENSPVDVLPIRYLELQLLTDMISGMTDSFAVDLSKRLRVANVD